MDDESASLPTGAAVTVEGVEARKEDASLELTEPLRESICAAGSVGGGS